MAKAKVYSHTNLIGTAELQLGDKSMGCVYGELLPTDYYYNNIQKSVWEFWKSSNPDYKKWHSLRFNVQLDNGYFLYAAGGFTFDDAREFPNEPKKIDIAGLDEYVIKEFFLQEEPTLFVKKPWHILSIHQKIAFEDELKKGIGK
ncbi:MAG: hypothetical protein H7Y04_00470 [Verrucomicrobia bacterium]|nr:hypothetical protein [Cytophagales bacterium]